MGPANACGSHLCYQCTGNVKANIMLGVKRYQVEQCKRLAKPKNVLEELRRSHSHLTRSLNDIYKSRKHELQHDLGISHDKPHRSQSRLGKAQQTLDSQREKQFSKSFYGRPHKLSASDREKKITTSLDRYEEPKLNTLVQNHKDHSKSSYLQELDDRKRSRSSSLLSNRYQKPRNRKDNHSLAFMKANKSHLSKV